MRLLIVMSCLLVGLAGCDSTGQDREPSPPLADSIEPDPAEALLGEDPPAVPLDVRTPAEFATGHIEGAVNVDIQGSDFEERLAELDHEATYIVYCTGGVPGGRSDRASERLRAVGVERVHRLVGGIVAWREAGKPVTEP